MHKELQNWLDMFQSHIDEADGPTAIASSLVQLGVITTGHCNCFEIEPIDEEDKQFETYFHGHHREFNSLVWEKIDAAMLIPSLRRVIRTDLTRGDNEFGEIVRKEYGRLLLNNFLTKRPNPEWVRR